MIIFGDYSTYIGIYPFRYQSLDIIQKSSTQKVFHVGSTFEYEFKPTANDAESVAFSIPYDEVVKQMGKELLKDVIGASLIYAGTLLLNPVGPEDLVSPSLIDEIVGVGLIWTGRFIMWVV